MRLREFYQLAMVCVALDVLVSARVLAEKGRRAAEPLAVTCACPGRPRPLGKAATCEEACYGQEALEAFEKEAAAEEELKAERERNLAHEAEQVQKANEDRMDAEAAALVSLTEDNLDASDAELLKAGTTIANPKRRKSRVRERASAQ